MALNVEKHREAILSAWREVLDDSSETNWALFGYEGLSNDLKFVSKGSSGLEELIEDLNSGKLMYAFLKVDVPESSVAKYVLINWQGEGAPTVRKGTCANHIKDVSRLLTGFHLTMHARTEDDLDLRHVLERLSRAGPAVQLGARTGDPARGPVGTAYQKVNPGKEINSEERDKFWMKQEQEERKRQEAERERKQEERRKAEEEVKRREQAARTNDTLSAPGGVSASEALRRQRSAEARQLIGGATSHARAMFEQNPHAVNNNRSIIPEKPVRSSIIAQRINSLQQQNQPTQETGLKPQEDKPKTSPIRNIDKIAMSLESPSQIQHEVIDPSLSPNGDAEPSFSTVEYQNENGTQEIKEMEHMVKQNIVECDLDRSHSSSSNDNDDDDDKFSTIKRSPHSRGNIAELSRQDTVIENVDYRKENGDCAYDDVPGETAEDDGVYQDLDDDPGLTARALYDYQAADATEISFDPGDVITHIDQIDEGWWQGLSPAGQFGLFPANYVQLLPAKSH